MAPGTSPHHHTAKKIILAVLVVPLSIFVLLIAVLFVSHTLDQSARIQEGTYLEPRPAAPAAPANEYEGTDRQLIEGVDNYSIGAEDPVVTIVQFSDFACPFCLASFPAMREVSVKHADTVRIIFRDWPGHEHSINLAMAAYCAGEQGKFWEMHDKLFQNQSDTLGADKNDLAILAGQLGVYNTAFQTCFDTQKYLPAIRANYNDSVLLGVKGTPTWFINGRRIEGVLTSQDFSRLLDFYLK